MPAAPEMRFLARCLQDPVCSSPSPEDAAFDWDRLVELASWHGMLPLLTSRLLAPDCSSNPVPPAVLLGLRAHRVMYVGRTVTQLAALAELQREFDRRNLDVVAWKGPSTGLLLYGAATLREAVDLDFLFLEEDLQEVFALTRGLGYKLLGTCDSESKDIYILTRMREFTFGRKADQSVLEFHLQIMPSRFTRWQDSPADIERAILELPLGDVSLRLQRVEDLLVSLCAHATKHNWDRLKWTADIAKFLTRYSEELDWHTLLQTLERSGKHHVVLLGLALAQSIYEVPLPVPVTEKLARTQSLVRLASQVTACVMSGQPDAATLKTRKALVRLLCPRLRDRVAYMLIPMVELNYEDLYVPVHNRMLFFMNYFFRVVRLLRKYGPQRLAAKTAGSVRSVH